MKIKGVAWFCATTSFEISAANKKVTEQKGVACFCATESFWKFLDFVKHLTFQFQQL